MHFGSTLRLLRVDAGLSLRELGARIGVSSAYLSRVENGHDPPPTPDRLIAIADALGLPRPVLVELARQAGPAVSGYLERVPEAGALFLEIAWRDLPARQIARIKAFVESEFPVQQAQKTGPRLAELLVPSRIVLDLSCSDLEDLVTVAAARLGRRFDPRRVLLGVLEREREAPTALGGGFVAPHAVIEGAEDAAVLLTLARPLRLETPDNRPVRAAVLVVGGESAAAHREILARVARLARYDIADELCAARTREQARSIVQRIESLW
jgi:PTS system nitrogen regulatory IIA component